MPWTASLTKLSSSPVVREGIGLAAARRFIKQGTQRELGAMSEARVAGGVPVIISRGPFDECPGFHATAKVSWDHRGSPGLARRFRPGRPCDGGFDLELRPRANWRPARAATSTRGGCR